MACHGLSKKWWSMAEVEATPRIGWKLQYGRMYSKKKHGKHMKKETCICVSWNRSSLSLSLRRPGSHGPKPGLAVLPRSTWIPGEDQNKPKIYNQIVLQIRLPASPANQTLHGEVSAPQVAPGRLPSSSDGAPRFNWMICPGLAEKGIRASVRGPKSYCKWLRTCYESPYVNIPYVSYMCVSLCIYIYYLYMAHITLRKVQKNSVDWLLATYDS